MKGRTERALGVKSMPLNRQPSLSETEEYIESEEERIKELVQDDVAMELLEVILRDNVADMIKMLAQTHGLEVDIKVKDDE